MTEDEYVLLRELVCESCRPCPYWHSQPVTQSQESVEREMEWLKREGMIGLGKEITSSHVVPR